MIDYDNQCPTYKFDGKEELLLLTLTCKMTSDLTIVRELELTPRSEVARDCQLPK